MKNWTGVAKKNNATTSLEAFPQMGVSQYKFPGEPCGTRAM